MTGTFNFTRVRSAACAVGWEHVHVSQDGGRGLAEEKTSILDHTLETRLQHHVGTPTSPKEAALARISLAQPRLVAS